MIKKFEVSGFKNFSTKYTIDFADVRDYKFNADCINNNLLNKIIIYGRNTTGKSNLGLAMFDIVSHLTDKNVTPNIYDNFLNQDIYTEYAEFTFVFIIKNTQIEYSYRKISQDSLIWERVLIDNKLLFEYNFDKDYSQIKRISQDLNFEFYDNDISIVKFIANNTVGEKVQYLKSMVSFVNNMLWFRNLDENRYIGCKTNTKDYSNFINSNQMLNDFIKFLGKAGIHEKLIIKTNSLGEERLYFNKLKPIPFLIAASNGTKALYSLFYWLRTIKDITFLFIDEFDAFYHHELSETVVDILQQYKGFQTILTTHNTNLLTNRIMRPDCYFILTNNNITSIANATERELREGHNLEKLYKNGEFDA